MISIDTLAIGAPLAALLAVGLAGFVEYRWIERAKRREQLAAAAGAKISGHSSSIIAVNTQAAAE
jgi:hypothetical protein